MLCVFHQVHSHSMGALGLLSSGCLAESESLQASPAAPLPESGKGQQSLCMAEHSQDFWEQSLLWRASADPGCSTMASWSSLAFAALGSSPSCSSLASFPCFALDRSFLSSAFQTPFPLPFWHCPPSSSRDFSVLSRPLILVTL